MDPVGCTSGDDEDRQYYEYDPFEGIDLDTIPELTATVSQPSPAQSTGQSSALPDLQVPQAQSRSAAPCPDDARPTAHTTHPAGHPTTEHLAAGSRKDSPSTEYSEEEYDADFFAQLNSIESAILEPVNQEREFSSRNCSIRWK